MGSSFGGTLEPIASSVAAEAGALGPGRVIDARWRIASVAAANGNDTIYNALDEQTRQRVRVRVTPHPYDEALVGLVHPGLPPVVARGRVQRWWYTAHAWFDGAPLELPSAPDAPLGERRLRAWATTAFDALDALDHLHRSAGRCHGDLGLHSFWLANDGRLRLVDAAGPDGVLTPQAVPYASPERLRGMPRDVRSDLYSLGAVLYALAFGFPPFGSEPASARAGHLGARLPEGPVLPPEFFGVLRTAMEKQPHHRFASAARMRAALSQALRTLDGERPAPHLAPETIPAVDELPPQELDLGEPEGTLDPPPPRVRSRARRASGPPAGALVGMTVAGVVSVAAWVVLVGLVWSMASGQVVLP